MTPVARLWPRSGSILAALVALACGGDPAQSVAPRASLLEVRSAEPAFTAPAVWVYHPRKEAGLHAKLGLDGGRTLFAGERGERWLVEPGGRVVPAARLAPETLVAIERRTAEFVFLGRSGTLYESKTPLGAFTQVSAPVDDLVRVVSSGAVVLGVREDARLERRVGDEPWQDVGPREPRFVAVALSPDGRGLALAIPEALFETRDGGATWSELVAPTHGAVDILRDGESQWVLDAAFGPLAWKPGDGKFVPLGRAPASAVYELGSSLPLGPSAAALTEGRAFVQRGRYWELRPSIKPLSYSLISGPVTGPLAEKPAATFMGCRSVHVSGFAEVLVAACARGKPGAETQPIELYRSEDAGVRWELETFGLEGTTDALDLAVGASGTTLVTGVCLPSVQGRGCRASGVLRRERAEEDGGTSFTLTKVRSPGLDGPALAIAFAADGRRAFGIGRRSKTGSPALFVSDSGVESFEAEDLSMGKARRSADDEPKVIVRSTGSSEDGTVAFALQVADQPLLVVVDEQGRVLSETTPPGSGAAVGVAGSRALAVLPADGGVWESLDAGATWRPLGRPPLELCSAGRRCEIPVACHPGGCVLGDLLSRVGWNGQQDASSAGLMGARRAESRSLGNFTPRVKVPWSCAIGEAPWQSLPPRAAIPDADRAGFAGTLWFTISEDPETASVSLTRAAAGRRQVETVPLLPPVRHGEGYAYAASLQVEGAAALRYPVPSADAAAPQALQGAEVAWHDLLSGAAGRGRIPDAGPLQSGDYEHGPGAAARARPAMLSIGAGGLYVRPHNAAGDDQTTFFVQTGKTVSIPPVRWPDEVGRSGRSEMAHVDGTHVPLRISDVAVSRMQRSGGEWTPDAHAIGFRRPADFGLTQQFDIAYAGGRSGLHVTLDDQARGEVLSFILPFRATGPVLDPAVEVPTQRSIEADPRRCTDRQRSTTPRIVAPHHAGTRHPVLVTDSVEPLRILLTDRAVMHGTRSEPCVVAFDAELVSSEPSSPNERIRAILPLDGAEQAWLFRTSSDRNTAGTQVEFRPMSCRIDPSVEIPVEVYRARGTVVP